MAPTVHLFQRKIWTIVFVVLLISCSTKTSAIEPSKTAQKTQPDETHALPPQREMTTRPMFRGNSARNGRSAYKGPRSAKPKWTFQTNGRIYADPVIGDDGTIYIASLDGFLYAVSPDGKEKWSFDAEGKIWSTPSVADDGTIYFGSDADKLFALTPKGEVKWTLSTRLPPEKKGEKTLESQWDVDTSPAFSADGTIYFACHYFLYAVRPSGEVQWRFQAGIGRSKIFSSPAVGQDGTIFFGTQGKRLFAVNAAGVAIWNIETGGDNDSTPTVEGDTVYFASDDGKVRALSTATGDTRWLTDLGAPVRAPLTVGHDGTVFVATYGQKPFIAALEGKSGIERWRFFTEPGEGAFFGIQSGVLVDREGYLYFGGRDRFAYCLTPDGKLKWRYETGDQVDSGPVLGKDGTLYIGSDDMHLAAFE